MHAEATKGVQQRELALARQWRAARSATPAQKRYAAALLAGGGGAPGDGDGGAAAAEALAAGGGAEFRALFEERQARMQQEVAAHVQRALAGGADAERPASVLRYRVSGALPRALAGGDGGALGSAVLRLWRVGEEEEGLREGDVLRVTGVRAARSVDLGLGRMLQLDVTKMTRWEPLFRATDPQAADYCLQFEPRRALTLREAAAEPLAPPAAAGRAEFDFVGVLLWAAAVQDSGGCRGCGWHLLTAAFGWLPCCRFSCCVDNTRSCLTAPLSTLIPAK